MLSRISRLSDEAWFRSLKRPEQAIVLFASVSMYHRNLERMAAAASQRERELQAQIDRLEKSVRELSRQPLSAGQT